MYKNNMFGSLHTILQEQISDLYLLFSVILFIIDKLVKGISDLAFTFSSTFCVY